MTEQLSSKFDATRVQQQATDIWDAHKVHHAEPEPDRPADARFVVVIPPPNVTAQLHVGHALNNTLQDVQVRWHRMMGHNTVWLPGTDHAGIATQTVVDKRLKAEGKKALADYKKMELKGENGREQFVQLVQNWKDEFEQRITDQLKAMGCSCDWDRQRFTMDDICSRAVREAFFQLFKDELIYRGKRLVNWDPATQTALADDEVINKDVDGHFWYLKYPVVDESGADTAEHVTVATTRPETMLGDTAVAVNPDDEARGQFVGKHVRLPIVNRIIPIIADDYVVIPDPESDDAKAKMASGFLKVTPAHDPNDYDIGQRHKLKQINVMAPDATISVNHGWPVRDEAKADDFLNDLIGCDRYEARKRIVKWFEDQGLLAEVRPHRHAVGHSYRSDVPIEPYLSDQWYVKVTDNRLSQRALDTLNGGTGVSPVDRAIGTNLTRSKRNLPHWQTGGSTYFVTFKTQKNTELDEAEKAIVLDACRYWDGDKIELNLVCVMTDHVHMIFKPLQRGPDKWHSLESILHSIKSYTSHEINALRSSSGSIWLDESYDRIIRDENDYLEKWNYIWENPTRAGLIDNPENYDFLWQTPAEVSTTHRRDACATPSDDRTLRTRGSLTFTPQRYARTFATWHENIRDWCISRQLWWGHRIPVFFVGYEKQKAPDWRDKFDELLKKLGVSEDVAIGGQGHQLQVCSRTARSDAVLEYLDTFANPDLSLVVETDMAKRDEELREELETNNPGLPLRDNIDLFQELGKHLFHANQDSDVLDTWFSSALWPMSTMGWPDKTPELAAWNPTSLLCTAREIITLWVSRMTMFNLYFRDVVPFHDVFIHAMVQDGEGRKMSKSLGNGVDPLDIIETHGADALRYTLVAMATQTQDVRMPVEPDPKTGRNTSPKFDQGRNFTNKIWNATRFALSNLPEGEPATLDDPEGLSLADRWILHRLYHTLDQINTALRDYEFATYGALLYDFFWRDLCDWYLEAIKPTLNDTQNMQRVAATRATLACVLDAALRLLHPAMPFVTEALYQAVIQHIPQRSLPGLTLGEDAASCAITPWPITDATLDDPQSAEAFALMQQIVTALRDMRNSYKIPPRQTIEVSAATGDQCDIVNALSPWIESLAQVKIKQLAAELDAPGQSAKVNVAEMQWFGHDLIDTDAERDRLEKTRQDLQKQRQTLAGRLSNEGYVSKAPAHLVQQTRDQLAQIEQQLKQVEADLQNL